MSGLIGHRGLMLQPASGGGSGHRYWRVHVTATSTADAYFCSVAELELKQSTGGADQATGGTAISGTTFGGAFLPDSAFDNNPATMWSTMAGGPPDWIGYILPTEKEIRAITLQSSDTPTRSLRAPKDFALQWSDDGAAWTTVMTVTGQVGWGLGEVRSFNY